MSCLAAIVGLSTLDTGLLRARGTEKRRQRRTDMEPVASSVPELAVPVSPAEAKIDCVLDSCLHLRLLLSATGQSDRGKFA